ncbi:MAG: response regulator, partial [Kineosporiaceae bacterium]
MRAAAGGADPAAERLMTSILIVDDHPIVRQGLRSLLSNYPAFDVVGEAAVVEEALDQWRRYRPDVSLVDIRLGAGSGLDLVDWILEEDPGARVVVVSSFDDDEYVTRSLRAGALGYVLKVDSPSVLVTAIETVAAGQRALSPRVTAHLVEQLMGETSSPEPDLDQVELRMLTMLSRGMSNGQIADELYMSDTTVKRRLRVVFGKLGVSRRAEAVGAAARR